MSNITLWMPERDVVLHQALGKLAEECNELAKIATRCMIQGFEESDPSTDKPNRTQLMEEVADVRATMRWLFEVLDQPFKRESPREARKFDGFMRWQAMIEAEIASKQSAPLSDVVSRLIKWDKDFPVNCHNGYAGLKELDNIIASGKAALGLPEKDPL